MNTDQAKKSLLEREVFRSVLASLLCIALGLLAGYIVLFIINPAEAGRAMTALLKNFLFFPDPKVALEYFGSTLVKTAPLLLCTLSVTFAYRVGLFNIGASGQYTAGAGLALFLALRFHMPWFVCVLAAMAGGAALGALSGMLRAYRNVNEVISGIMLNWISLYSVNMLLIGLREGSSSYTMPLRTNSPGSLLPGLGLGALFSGNRYVTISLPLAVMFALLVWFIQEKTVIGYELKAAGLNKYAARYAGMKENRNIILTMAVSGCLAGLGAAFLFLSGIEQWFCGQTTVPSMGFRGIAAAFLGGLHPIGCIFSAYFIQHITSGGSYVDRMVYASQISDMITSIIIYVCGFALFFRHCLEKIAEGKKGGGT